MLPYYSMTQAQGLSSLLKWEVHPDFSREPVTLLAGSGSVRKIVLGTILALLATTADVTAVSAADAGNTGDGTLTIANPAVTTAVKEGVYTVVCTDPAVDTGTFEVSDPDGKSIGTAKVGVAFGKQIRFTIADGATDFVAGDRFEVTVTKGDINPNAGKVVAWDPAGAAGSEIPWGIAATTAEAPDGTDLDLGLIALRRQVLCFEKGIVWPDGVTAAQKAEALEALEEQGIVVRTA
ncbi:head decoration protein [Roseibium sediminicola]|uniref:Head decoration protein n=1 Tax=Roseibium sediminicola TaxID=2933272 RepID=A0ABT0GRC0_9HYPH|nr:head decoration protein [Roseibium sp. CAU 1639]MCK7611972.1 head decoration protein [Roseibium sp. CAU 1639]